MRSFFLVADALILSSLIMLSSFELQDRLVAFSQDALFPFSLAEASLPFATSNIVSPAFSLKLAAIFAVHFNPSFALFSSRNFFIDSKASLQTFNFLQPQLTALGNWLSLLHVRHTCRNRTA